MQKKKEFVDALAGIDIRNGVVRLDFGEIEVQHDQQPKEGEAAPTSFEITHRLYMPVPGFHQALQVMQKMMGRVEEEIKKQQAAQTTTQTSVRASTED